MIAFQFESISNALFPTEQYVYLHAGCLWNQMNVQQHRSDRQNAPEDKEASRLTTGRSYVPMRHLNLLPVGHLYS